MDHELEADALKLPEEATQEELPKQERACQTNSSPVSTWRLVNAATAASQQTKVPLTVTANKLSSPVMEYYQKFAQNKNLNQYFSLSDLAANPLKDAKYYYSIYELTPKYVSGSQSYTESDYALNSYLPRERKRWTRPALIGQSSSVNGTSDYIQSMTEQSAQSLTENQQYQQEPESLLCENADTSTEGLVITEEKSTATTSQTSPLLTIEHKTTTSPTSSVASHKPLEWDSGADVGYQYQATNGGVSTIERMAVKALRLDPEGTTEHQQLVVNDKTDIDKNVIGGKPDANSTPLLGNVTGSDSEIEITPIVKSHTSGIIAGDRASSEEVDGVKTRSDPLKETKNACIETPKSANVFKLPLALSYSSDEPSKSKSRVTVPTIVSSSKERSRSDKSSDSSSPLKKSSSMNLLAAVSPTRLPLKRSQSELNLWGNEKALPRLIFNSTSSIATVVNNIKPPTCNKLIQTSMRICAQESIGVQVSVLKDEERPPLPKRATSLAPRSLNSILKGSKSTFKIQNPKNSSSIKNKSTSKEEEQHEKEIESSSDQSSQNASLTPCADDTENITGRANSFEYFPGHIYENVPNGSSSHVSSVDTGRSNSTMPNTSSSIEEKLWGDSDSLVRDLERSIHILKGLVDANKLDKQVKKRLIHHVVKRLVTAKYTDDKIEHNLEENVPWNPADARNKVYRTEIIQALAKNTTDSSDDWKPTQKKKSPKKSAPAKESKAMKDMISMPAEIESSNSDKFDRNTDRTVMDGRKARMGLRADDCERRNSSNTPTNKSESSECFLPQRQFAKIDKMKDMFITSTSNSSPQDQNRALLDAVVNSRRSPVDSSNEAGNSADWRMPTTMSERRYEMRRCSNSDSGDTKLVSYAEMEKQNQLIWITNEISHLSNLKKLLEQPKTKPDRPCKPSPRKTKQSSSKQQQQQQQKSYHRLQNDDLDDVRLNRQWSSHCNLATCPSPCTNSIKRLKKRNSSTQTATENSAAYSRTGSEIVSARIQSPNEKVSHVCVQTSRTTSALPRSSQTCSSCPVHRPATATNYTCAEQACTFCRSKNRLHRRQFSSDEDKNEARFMCNDSEDAKAAKNHLNANKLKCTCESNDQVSQNLKTDRPKKLATAIQTCKECHCEDSMCSCLRYKIVQSTCQSSRDCECANKLVCGFEKLQMRDNPPSRKKLFEKSACTCKYKNSEVAPSTRTECNHHSSQGNACDFLNSNQSPSSRNCCWVHQAEDQNKLFNGAKPKHAVKSLTNDCKCCRLCGTTYQTNRQCNCAPKVYPKAVAYELSFTNDNDKVSYNMPEKSSVGVEVTNIEKNTPVVSSARSQEPLNHGSCTYGMQRPFKRCDCNCKDKQSQTCDDKKTTLQGYLATNHPRFADNVESRRQYVSEIQRLRQLRKDRRMQLLAMTTTPNIFSPPQQHKVIQNVQMKISDQEMKARLRKRYFQLSEVRAKRKEQQLQEQARCNKLMAKIFCKKLQQKVLKGQVNLSQSVSVISNL
ncbi:uncharacterized protein LOC131671478 isoform X2 [Phymastichus coffea]|uniref:uncharacterized protein LOC131671478 isoform X2 n=1 Tax=Phymastichus coffea TaxID=108790 RepID=UPI00273ADE82|nr:uncharacterized protein LOC131671478 isoform X2 [Phymastichus coffea]